MQFNSIFLQYTLNEKVIVVEVHIFIMVNSSNFIDITLLRHDPKPQNMVHNTKSYYSSEIVKMNIVLP